MTDAEYHNQLIYVKMGRIKQNLVRLFSMQLNLQKVHPSKVRFTCWHRTCITFKTVIVPIVVVPKCAANIDGIVADGKFKSAANGNALWQINGEREAIS